MKKLRMIIVLTLVAVSTALAMRYLNTDIVVIDDGSTNYVVAKKNIGITTIKVLAPDNTTTNTFSWYYYDTRSQENKPVITSKAFVGSYIFTPTQPLGFKINDILVFENDITNATVELTYRYE